MDIDLLKRTIAEAEAEIAAVADKVRALEARARQLRQVVASCRGMLRNLTETEDVAAAGHLGPQGDLVDGTRVRSERRRLVQGVFDEALGIIERAGRPVTSAEVLAEHSAKDTMTNAEMYRLLRKRHDQRRFIKVEGGRFTLRSDTPVDTPTDTPGT